MQLPRRLPHQQQLVQKLPVGHVLLQLHLVDQPSRSVLHLLDGRRGDVEPPTVGVRARLSRFFWFLRFFREKMRFVKREKGGTDQPGVQWWCDKQKERENTDEKRRKEESAPPPPSPTTSFRGGKRNTYSKKFKSPPSLSSPRLFLRLGAPRAKPPAGPPWMLSAPPAAQPECRVASRPTPPPAPPREWRRAC